MMPVRNVIKRAEAKLRKVATPGEPDRRWGAILDVGVYSDSDPEEVWGFIERWGQHEDADLRMGIGLCLLEHFLGSHFELIFPRVERVALASTLFADTFRYCRKMGQAESPEYEARWDALVARLDLGPAA
jgi:hypothetical protein